MNMVKKILSRREKWKRVSEIDISDLGSIQFPWRHEFYLLLLFFLISEALFVGSLLQTRV